MKRALTYNEIVAQVFEEIPFTGKWQKFLGNPSFGNMWFIYADSANGKSSLVMQLLLELGNMGDKGKKILYNALEEYRTKSFQDRVKLFNMADIKGKFHVVKETIEELRIRLKKKNAPDIVVIDSIQYLRVRKEKFFDFLEEFPDVTFIVISQSENGKPRGSLAVDCSFEAYIKIYVDQFMAYMKGRATPPKDGGIFDIYKEEAEKLGHHIL